MGRKIYSETIETITAVARKLALSYSHSCVATPHLYLSTIAVLNEKVEKHQDDAETVNMYSTVLNTVKRIVNSYGVDGNKFKDAFFTLFPPDTNKETLSLEDIKIHNEASAVMSILRSDAIAKGRTAGLTDLIRELFTDQSYRLRNVMNVAVEDPVKVDKMCEEIIEAFRSKDAIKIEELEKLNELTNLNAYLLKNPQTIVGMDNAVQQIKLALSCKNIKCAMLLGKAGTGKTSAVYEFVNRINNGTIGKEFSKRIVYQLDCGAMVANCRFRGDLEGKITRLIELLKKHPEVILFIDEAHTFAGLGGSSDGAVSASNIIKPYITRGELQIIGATTEEEYHDTIAKDKAFARRFHNVRITEPTSEETLQILRGIKTVNDKYFGRISRDDVIERIVDLSEKYSLEEANPAKAMNMFELACAHAKTFNENGKEVILDDVMEAVRIRYDLIIVPNRVEKTMTELRKQVLGQDDVLKYVERMLKGIEMGLPDPKKPLASILLSGSTGTGKTFLAELIAKNFFGSEKNLIKIAGGEYGKMIAAV